MRVYIPVHAAQWSDVLSGRWEPVHAFAVTDTLRAVSSLDDEDELAEVARDAAAAASVSDLGSPLRCVAVVDFPRADVAHDARDHPAGVTLTGRVATADVACAFTDDAGAAEVIAQAVSGDQEAWDVLRDLDLLWYDASEIAYLPQP